jgi:hypothetical protein
MQHATPQRWIRLSVLATRTGYSSETLRQAVIKGQLKASRHGVRGMYRVPETEANRFVAELEARVA